MKKLLSIFLILFCSYFSYGQQFVLPTRSSPVITVQDARWRGLMTAYMPHTHGLTLNGGLDTLGAYIYEDSSRHVWYRDSILSGGHKWTMVVSPADINITGLIQQGANITITGSGTPTSPYIINSSGGGGGGSIVGAGNLTPLFTTGVAFNQITFAFQNAAAFRIFGNPTNANAPPIYFGTDATMHFVGGVLGVDTAALAISANYYQTITQIDSFTFTLNTPPSVGRHDTVRIKLPTNGFVSNLNNGLTLTGTLGQLGGPLVQNTVINGGGFSLGIQGNRFATGMGAAIAAANNLTTGSDGNLFSVTGSTQINAIATTNWQAGSEISFIFTGSPILKNNTAGGGGTAVMLLAGSIDYQAAPGDYIKLQYDGTAWHEVTRKLTSSGGAYIFSNGITESPATRVKLGGTLTQNTTLAGAGSFWFAINSGRFEVGQGAAVAAANNLTLGNDGNLFSITGNTQINAITTTNFQAGSHIEFVFTGTPTLKNNTAGGINTATMLLAGSIDYTAAAGDLIGFTYDGTNWHETNRKLAGSVTAITLNNGLTLTGTNGQLGGALVQTTTINAGAGFQLAVNGAARSSSSAILAVNLSGASSVTTPTAASFSNTATGSASINTALSGTASGASFSNIGLKGTATGTGAIGVSGQGDQNGVSGTGNIGVVGTPTAGSGQAGVKGDGSANTVAGVWGVGNPGVFGQGNGGGGNVGVYGQSAGIGVAAETQDPGTNNISTALQIIRSGTSSPTPGYGASIDFFMGLSGSPSSALSNQIYSTWYNTTGGAQSSQLVITGYTTAVKTTLFTFDGTLSTSYVPIASQQTPASTNTVIPQMFLQRLTSGTPTVGIGTALYYQIQNTTNTLSSASLEANLTNATGGSTSSQFNIKLLNNGASLSNALTLDGNGNMTTYGGQIIHIVTTAAGTYVILANDYEVVATGTTSTWTLPAHVAGRSLKLVNQGSGAITIAGGPITTANGVTTTTIAAGSNFIVDDDGTTYRKTN